MLGITTDSPPHLVFRRGMDGHLEGLRNIDIRDDPVLLRPDGKL